MAGQLVDKAANAIASSTSKASTDSIFWPGIGDDGTTAMNYAKQNGGINPGSTFSRFELPELLNNKNVTSIKYIDIEP